MSVSNLLAPNNYELYINNLHTNILNTNIFNTGSLGVTGVLSAFEINIGNSIGPTGFQPYFSTNTVNYVGLIVSYVTPTVVRLLSIGNFVFLYINTLSFSDSLYLATEPLTIDNLIPPQFRPKNDIYCSATCINNGASVAGIGLIDTGGSVSWGLSGNPFINFNGATGIAGAQSLIACWSIN